MLAHDGANGLRSLIGVIEGNAGHVMVEDVGLDNAVEELTTDEAKLTIDSGSSAANKVPLFSGVVRKRGISVLEESNGNCVC